MKNICMTLHNKSNNDGEMRVGQAVSSFFLSLEIATLGQQRPTQVDDDIKPSGWWMDPEVKIPHPIGTERPLLF